MQARTLRAHTCPAKPRRDPTMTAESPAATLVLPHRRTAPAALQASMCGERLGPTRAGLCNAPWRWPGRHPGRRILGFASTPASSRNANRPTLQETRSCESRPEDPRPTLHNGVSAWTHDLTRPDIPRAAKSNQHSKRGHASYDYLLLPSSLADRLDHDALELDIEEKSRCSRQSNLSWSHFYRRRAATRRRPAVSGQRQVGSRRRVVGGQ